jgi:hypothetical protein
VNVTNAGVEEIIGERIRAQGSVGEDLELRYLRLYQCASALEKEMATKMGEGRGCRLDARGESRLRVVANRATARFESVCY